MAVQTTANDRTGGASAGSSLSVVNMNREDLSMSQSSTENNPSLLESNHCRHRRRRLANELVFPFDCVFGSCLKTYLD